MSETITNASRALSDWPLWNAVFLVIVALAGIALRFMGNRDRKAGVTGMEMPLYIMLHDAARDVGEIKTEMQALNRGQEYTHRLMEAVLRDQELRPDPVSASAKPVRRG